MTKFDHICIIIKDNIKKKICNHFFDKIQKKCKKIHMKQAYTKYFSHFVGVLATFRHVDVIFPILATLLSILGVAWVYLGHFAVGGTFGLILRGFGSFGVLSG
jgi:hypothetical protein